MPPVNHEPLKPSQLRRRFDPAKVPFETSDRAPDCEEVVLGQTRAKRALEFGLAIREPGYHVFVAGPPRTGKMHLVTTFLEGLARKLPPPPDWVYVYNFKDPDQPRALRLPPGGGRQLVREMEELVERLKQRIPEIFEGEDYSRRKDQLAAEFKARRSDIFQALDKQAREQGYVLRFESTGIMVAPADEDGQVLSEERIRELDEDQREALRKKADLIQAEVAQALRRVTAMEKELEQSLRKLEREMVLFAVGPLFDELFDQYVEYPDVYLYLEQVREDVSKNFRRFRKQEAPQLPIPVPQEPPSFKEYTVNLFVDNSEQQGAPVVVEDHPTFPNLFGRIERQMQMGALVTDFTLLSAGALHRANGGFLVLPVLELLKLGLPYDGLKRALTKARVVMEDAMEQFGLISARSLRPEPIPLDIKVILVGESQLFSMLHAHDPQFPKLFKVRAQMSEHMHWRSGEVHDFIAHLCNLAKDCGRMPLHRGAVARLVELAGELAGDRERLTLRLSELRDVVSESIFLARQAGRRAVTAEEVDQAVERRRRRVGMVEDRLREAMLRGFINIETEGARIGQINGLSVLQMGDHAFGQPSRISVSLGPGKAGVVAIDRESKLSGPFHTKGVLILEGFLRERFGQDGPLALTAGLTFEQSYSMIDGDSASLAELLVIISRLAGVPLRQDLAVTGSVSQLGQVQAIGGVNWKIEGFFRLCKERGLTGSQGVVIPAANVKNLMLHREVVSAARRGRFAVYAVETVEEALEIFTGLKAGRRLKSGAYSKGSVFEKARQELLRLRESADGGKKKTKPRRKKK